MGGNWHWLCLQTAVVLEARLGKFLPSNTSSSWGPSGSYLVLWFQSISTQDSVRASQVPGGQLVDLERGSLSDWGQTVGYRAGRRKAAQPNAAFNPKQFLFPGDSGCVLPQCPVILSSESFIWLHYFCFSKSLDQLTITQMCMILEMVSPSRQQGTSWLDLSTDDSFFSNKINNNFFVHWSIQSLQFFSYLQEAFCFLSVNNLHTVLTKSSVQ